MHAVDGKLVHTGRVELVLRQLDMRQPRDLRQLDNDPLILVLAVVPHERIGIVVQQCVHSLGIGVGRQDLGPVHRGCKVHRLDLRKHLFQLLIDRIDHDLLVGRILARLARRRLLIQRRRRRVLIRRRSTSDVADGRPVKMRRRPEIFVADHFLVGDEHSVLFDPPRDLDLRPLVGVVRAISAARHVLGLTRIELPR